MSEVERRLQGALVPVEPPIALSDRYEQRLTEITNTDIDKLADFDPKALRDPRRWGRLVAAGVVSVGAGGALIVVRARHKREAHGLRALRRATREVADDARRRLAVAALAEVAAAEADAKDPGAVELRVEPAAHSGWR